MYIKTVSDRLCYGAEEVLGRDAFYYPDSTVRLVGWASAVSVIYTRDCAVCLRFREAFVSYAQRFDEASRTVRFRTAVNHICAEHPAEPFRPLTAEELHTLEMTETLSEEFVLSDAAIYGAETAEFFVPVRADAAMVFRTAYGENTPTNEAAIYTFDQRYAFACLGFDGRLYSRCADGVRVAETESFDRPEPWPEGVAAKPYPTLEVYREYAVVGTDCYRYDGQYLEADSAHHRTCAVLKELYGKLRKRPIVYAPERPHIVLTLPRLQRVTRSLITDMLIPAMQAERALDRRKLAGLERLIAVIDRAGIKEDFYEVLERLMRLNRDRLCGGSSRHFCSRELALRLNTLADARTQAGFAALLRDEEALTEALRALHTQTDGERRSTRWFT